MTKSRALTAVFLASALIIVPISTALAGGPHWSHGPAYRGYHGGGHGSYWHGAAVTGAAASGGLLRRPRQWSAPQPRWSRRPSSQSATQWPALPMLRRRRPTTRRSSTTLHRDTRAASSTTLRRGTARRSSTTLRRDTARRSSTTLRSDTVRPSSDTLRSATRRSITRLPTAARQHPMRWFRRRGTITRTRSALRSSTTLRGTAGRVCRATLLPLKQAAANVARAPGRAPVARSVRAARRADPRRCDGAVPQPRLWRHEHRGRRATRPRLQAHALSPISGQARRCSLLSSIASSSVCDRPRAFG